MGAMIALLGNKRDLSRLSKFSTFSQRNKAMRNVVTEAEITLMLSYTKG